MIYHKKARITSAGFKFLKSDEERIKLIARTISELYKSCHTKCKMLDLSPLDVKFSGIKNHIDPETSDFILTLEMKVRE